MPVFTRGAFIVSYAKEPYKQKDEDGSAVAVFDGTGSSACVVAICDGVSTSSHSYFAAEFCARQLVREMAAPEWATCETLDAQLQFLEAALHRTSEQLVDTQREADRFGVVVHQRGAVEALALATRQAQTRVRTLVNEYVQIVSSESFAHRLGTLAGFRLHADAVVRATAIAVELFVLVEKLSEQARGVETSLSRLSASEDTQAGADPVAILIASARPVVEAADSVTKCMEALLEERSPPRIGERLEALAKHHAAMDVEVERLRDLFVTAMGASGGGSSDRRAADASMAPLTRVRDWVRRTWDFVTSSGSLAHDSSRCTAMLAVIVTKLEPALHDGCVWLLTCSLGDAEVAVIEAVPTSTSGQRVIQVTTHYSVKTENVTGFIASDRGQHGRADLAVRRIGRDAIVVLGTDGACLLRDSVQPHFQGLDAFITRPGLDFESSASEWIAGLKRAKLHNDDATVYFVKLRAAPIPDSETESKEDALAHIVDVVADPNEPVAGGRSASRGSD